MSRAPVPSSSVPAVVRAFVPGAGLGTRLRPLTNLLPKPLIPLWHRPLVEHVFAHLHDAGIRSFVVNTHHLPDAWPRAFPDSRWNGCNIAFRHEPVLLETGGGLANAADLLGDGPFVVYNGDTLTDLPLAPAIRRHVEAGNLVTVVLRSEGRLANVAFDPESGRVLDFRNVRGIANVRQFQFTGIYVVDPAFLRFLEPGRIESVVPAFLRAIDAGERIGGIAIDDGICLDPGDRRSYLAAHAMLAGRPWRGMPPPADRSPLHPDARVDPSARVDAVSCVCAGASVGADAVLEGSIVWPGGIVAPGAHLRGCIVRTGMTAAGALADADV